MSKKADPAPWENVWKPVKDDLKHVVIIAGVEGSGKTHWAVENSPGPHYLIDTEGAHNLHTAAELDPELRAITLAETPEVDRDSKWFSGKGTLWDELKRAVIQLREAPSGTVIIDSGSDLTAMVVAQFSIDWDRGDKAFPTMLYGQVYAELGSIVAEIRKRHNLVITAQLKEIYRGEDATGKFTTALWKKADYLAEHIIYVTNGSSGRSYKTRRLKRNAVKLPEVKWEWLVNGIPEDAIQESIKAEIDEGISKGVEMIQKIKEDAIKPAVLKKIADGYTIEEGEKIRTHLQDLYAEVKEAARSRRRNKAA